jgi:hypothetical protein
MVPEQARRELQTVDGRDSILDLFFDYARQYFDYSALFVVHSDIAEGREAYGDGASRDRVQAIGVPLDLPSVLAAARDAGATVKVAPADDGLDPVLLGDLERKTRGEVLVVPIVVRGRSVALFYGDSGDDGVDPNAARDVAGFANLVGQRFEGMIVRKKLQGHAPGQATAPSVPAAPAPSSHVPANDATDDPSREPLHTVPMPRAPEPAPLESPARESGVAEPTPEPRVATPEPRVLEAALESRVLEATLDPRSVEAIAEGHVPQAMPAPRGIEPTSAPLAFELRAPAPLPGPVIREINALDTFDDGLDSISSRLLAHDDRPPPETTFVVRRPSGPPIPREEPGEHEIPPFPPPATPPPVTPPPAPAAHSFQPPAPPPPAAAPFPPATPPPPAAAASDSAPPSASFAVAPHRPPSSRVGEGLELPSVIVDVDETSGALVDRVVATGSDEVAEAELIRQGRHAMPAIMSRFPGPTVVDRARVEDGSLRAAECGPVLRLIAGQRRAALPFVLPIVGDGDPSRRYWATFLMTELAYPEVVEALVPRLFDPDPSVRKVARLAARAVADVAPEALMERLVRYYRDPALSLERRIEMIETIGELRERLAVPLLIDALGDAQEETAAAARRALMIATRQDLGRDAKKWQGWWAQNAGRHRIEWLIDALMHEVPAIRRAAGDEVKALTKEYFGYYDDLPRKEREKAQQRYRDWWAAEGRLRFQRR